MSLLAQDTKLARRVGAVGLVVGLAAIVFFVFVWDRIEWGAHVRLKIYFRTAGGLHEGAPIDVAGRDIGTIEAIALVPRGTPSPLDGEDGVVVTVLIETDWAKRITLGGDVFVASRGALSGKYLEIAPAPAPGPSIAEAIKAGNDKVRGRDPPTLDRVLQRTLDNLNTTSAFADEVRPALHDLQAQVATMRTTLDSLAPDIAFRADVIALLDEASTTKTALGGDAGLDRISKVMDEGGDFVTQARTTMAQVRASADELGAGLDGLKARLGTKGAEAIEHVEQAIDRVKAAIDKVDPLLAQVQELQASLERGDGSLMKLMHDPEFPEDAKELGKILKRQPWKLIDHPK